MTLSWPLQPTPLLGSVLGDPVSTKGINGHRRGKTINGPKRGHMHITKLGLTRLMSTDLIRVARAHNLPLLEAPARGMTIDRIRALP